MAKRQKRKKQKPGNSWQAAKSKQSGSWSVSKNRFGDSYLAQINGSDFDAVSSVEFYKSAYGEQLFQQDVLYIFVGTDSGLLPKFIQSQGVPANSKYLFFEPEDVYEQIGKSLLCPDLVSEIVVSGAEQLFEVLAGPALSPYIHADKNLFFESVVAKKVNYSGYSDLTQTVKKEWMDRIWRTKVAVNQKTFIEKQLENLGENRISSICLKGAFKGMTAVLLGGGPSLDDALPWIKENRDKFVVLAISRVCRRLREVDLIPDIVFSVDPFPINYENSVDLFHFAKKTLFIHCHHVAPQLLSQWSGRSVYSGDRFPWATPLNVETLSLANPTVTNTALVSAVDMGFAKVILAGVDLCHGQDGISHAQGNIEFKMGTRISNDLLQVQTNGGWLADTPPAYANAISELGRQVEQAILRGCVVINSALGAAVVPSLPYQPVEKINLDCLHVSIQSIIDRIFPEESVTARTSHYHTIETELDRWLKLLQHGRCLVVEAQLCIEEKGASGNNDLTQIEGKLQGSCHELLTVVETFGALDPYRPFGIGTKGEYYSSFINVLDQLIETVEKSQQRVQSRNEEEKDSPDYTKLFQQWRRDDQPGRAVLWQESHPDITSQAASVSHQQLGEFVSQFRNIIQSFNAKFHNEYVPPLNIDHAINRVGILFKGKNSFELERVVERLSREYTRHRFEYLIATRPPQSNQKIEMPLQEIGDGIKITETDSFFVSVYLDPVEGPDEVILQWHGENWCSQVRWGAICADCSNDCDAVEYMGVLPPLGEWVCLEIPANCVDSRDGIINGFAVFFDQGFVYWDNAGHISVDGQRITWKQDLDSAGFMDKYLGEGWDWFGAPPLFDFTSNHLFLGAKSPLELVAGDRLFVEVFLEPKKLPEQIMLQLNSGNWEHRAYWGENRISWGVPGTESCYCMGSLPEAGQWSRLEVPCETMGLVGKFINGSAFTIYGGRAIWRKAGVQSELAGDVVWVDEYFPDGAKVKKRGNGWRKVYKAEVESLNHLVVGCLAELDSDDDAALAEYFGALAKTLDCNALLKGILIRILTISTKRYDVDNILAALQCLTEVDIKYAPQYARTLQRFGEKSTSAEVYSRYLENVPTDISALMALGSLYLEMGVPEAAKIAFEAILEQDPDNQKANYLRNSLEDGC